MPNSEKIYDWIVVGGGISGITIAEILSRQRKSVLLIEKNASLASETSKEFHEWFHSGALYTLVPDDLLTLRYLLGATDDLFEYYKSFPGMNLFPTESGVNVKSSGWFNQDNIEYKFRVHKFNPIWLSIVSRSISIINMIKKHDWLRRRAGSEYGKSRVNISHWFTQIPYQIRSKSRFLSISSPDFTMNSRILISDIISAALSSGLDIQLNSKIQTIEDCDDYFKVIGKDQLHRSKKVVITSPDAISDILDIPIKYGYAPMAIAENVGSEINSFVELDYYPSRCINLLKKDKGIGQIGGITLDNENKIGDYLEYIIKEHKSRNPSINILDSYIGVKKELVQSNQERNYLYHINQHKENLWSVVLGKFSLAFSMAPEFYRRAYNENPSDTLKTFESKSNHKILSKTSWQEIVSKRS